MEFVLSCLIIFLFFGGLHQASSHPSNIHYWRTERQQQARQEARQARQQAHYQARRNVSEAPSQNTSTTTSNSSHAMLNNLGLSRHGRPKRSKPAVVAAGRPLSARQNPKPLAGIHRVNQCNVTTWFQPFYEGSSGGSGGENQQPQGAWTEDHDFELFINGTAQHFDDNSAGAGAAGRGQAHGPRGPFELPPHTDVFSRYHMPARGAVSEKFVAQNFAFNALGAATAVTQFEYNVRPGEIWFDLSFVDCVESNGGGRLDYSACVFGPGGFLLTVDDAALTEAERGEDGCRGLRCPATAAGAGPVASSRKRNGRNAEPAGGSGGEGGEKKKEEDEEGEGGIMCNYSYDHAEDTDGTTHCGSRDPASHGTMYDNVNLTLVLCPTEEQLRGHARLVKDVVAVLEASGATQLQSQSQDSSPPPPSSSSAASSEKEAGSGNDSSSNSSSSKISCRSIRHWIWDKIHTTHHYALCTARGSCRDGIVKGSPGQTMKNETERSANRDITPTKRCPIRKLGAGASKLVKDVFARNTQIETRSTGIIKARMFEGIDWKEMIKQMFRDLLWLPAPEPDWSVVTPVGSPVKGSRWRRTESSSSSSSRFGEKIKHFFGGQMELLAGLFDKNRRDLPVSLPPPPLPLLTSGVLEIDEDDDGVVEIDEEEKRDDDDENEERDDRALRLGGQRSVPKRGMKANEESGEDLRARDFFKGLGHNMGDVKDFFSRFGLPRYKDRD